MKRIAIVLPLLYFLITGSLSLFASSISINIDPFTKVENDEVSCLIELKNTGDENACNVSISIIYDSTNVTTASIGNLDYGKKISRTFPIGKAPMTPGAFNAICKVVYHDSNGYAFSALRSIPFTTNIPEDRKEPISGKIKKVYLIGTSKPHLYVTNSSDTAISISSRLYTPDEVESAISTEETIIPPHSEADVPLYMRNKSALKGSTYYAFAILDYNHKGFHFSTTIPFNILVKSNKTDSPLPWAIPAIILFALLIVVNMSEHGCPAVSQKRRLITDILVFYAIYIYICMQLTPHLILLNTVNVGGDTPAHNYLASHLKEQLFQHGRIISWADGWWCGFPMFQYYFCLPYLITAFVSLIIPFNIALKLVSVSGILLLPLTAYLSARRMKLPEPSPILCAAGMIPFLFDTTHTMWGVNIYSTLAGMISNSLSFSLLVLFIGCMWRDVDEGRFRISTTILLVLTIASHFFTTIMACAIIIIMPFLRPQAGFRRSIEILFKTSLSAFLLMAWWIVPLIAKSDFTTDFGTNWDVKFFKQLPQACLWVSPLLIPAVIGAFTQRLKVVAIFVWMLVISILLFFYGFDLSPVFVNIRLWPFIIYTIVMLEIIGAAVILMKARFPELGISAFVILCIFGGIEKPNNTGLWASWNFSGLESKSYSYVFDDLIMPLKNTPGRLANDLSGDNDKLGSTRIFELVPHLIGKPVLEGGIVNSAVGSMFSYYIQGEISSNTAGFPPIVIPTNFDLEAGTKHLKLFNVKHFIARHPLVKQSLADDPGWKLLGTSAEWQLYELTDNNGSYIFVPPYKPKSLLTESGLKDWKHAGLNWIYNRQSLDHFFALLPQNTRDASALSWNEFDSHLRTMSTGKSAPGWEKIDTDRIKITHETVSNDLIRFDTTGTGMPHIIKCTYFPNWKSRNGEMVYMVTPCFMMIYPQNTHVELYYGSTISDNIGRFLTIVGLFILGLQITVRIRKYGRHEQNEVIKNT